MEQPLVSIIVNCYNSEKFLQATIDSILSQTYDNYEIIFWDNCSEDSTGKIVKSYNDTRFKYYCASKNVPLGEARNNAMREIHGKFFCFLDSDDLWDVDFLKTGVGKLIENSSIVGFYSNYDSLCDNIRKPRKVNIQDGIHSLSFVFKNYCIGMSACILRTDVVKNNNILFDNTFQLIEDLDFFVSVLKFGDFYYSSKPLMIYRVYMGNSSNSKLNLWAGEFSQYYNKVLKDYVNIQNPYLKKKDLRWIKHRIVYFRTENDIKTGQRWDVIKCLLSTPCVPLRLWCRSFYSVLGPCFYKWIKGNRAQH